MIALTFDTDWVQEEYVKPVADILKAKKIKATFFATHEHECLKRCRLFEVNPHFNFMGNWTDYEKGFEKLKTSMPKSVSIRNHSLYNHERLRMIWQRHGIKYTSNTSQPLKTNIEPYYFCKKIIEFPIYFMDYWYMERFRNPDFRLKALKLRGKGLKIFDFHPIHLALNTPNLAYYENHKEEKKHQAYKGKGVKTLFDELTDYIEKNKIETYKLRELYQKFK